jgi:hypothetical protein
MHHERHLLQETLLTIQVSKGQNQKSVNILFYANLRKLMPKKVSITTVSEFTKFVKPVRHDQQILADFVKD